jgi:hypothetical protein
MKLKTPRIIKGWAHGRRIVPASGGYRLNEVSPGRKFAMEESDPSWLDSFAAFGLVPDRVEPMYKILTGVHFLEGAFTQTHTDPAPSGMVHVRCNVMLKKPPAGGMPLVDGEEFSVDEGDLWIVLASLEQHGSTPISAPERVIKSFGGLVPKDQVAQLINPIGENHV